MIEEVRDLMRAGRRSILIQSPTGSGKTAMCAHMIRNAVAKGFRVWFINHRREIIRQSVLTLVEAADLDVGITAAGFPANRNLPVQVCSIQTLARRHPLLTPPDLIIWDEAHHTAAKSWATIHQAYPRAFHIGLTATPERLDGRGLIHWFSNLLVGPSVASLIADGWLAPYRMFAPSAPELAAVHTVAGDYNKKELATVMERSAVVGDAISHYQQHAAGRRAIVFMWSIEASIAMALRFHLAGIPAAHIDGETSHRERDQAIQDFRDGTIKVLSNVDIVSEGFDLPAVEVAVLLRPTQSLALYLQQVGRVLRPQEGKTALILDHAGNCRRHGLPDDEHTWSLDGRPKSSASSDACPVKQCPACYAMIGAAAQVCRYCGFVFEGVPREVDQAEGELVELDLEQRRRDRRREQGSANSLEDLVRIGHARGYRYPQRWAEHVWMARQRKHYEKVG